MKGKFQVPQLYLYMFLLLLVPAAQAAAGPAAIGLVAGSTNASVGGKALLPHTALFSGDRLEVNDGLAVVALGNKSRIVFYPDTVVSFLRNSREVTVLLGQGHVSLFHSQSATPLRVKVGDVSVAPVLGFETQGEVATRKELVVVTARDGRLQVEANGQTIDLAKGETITVAARAVSLGGPREGAVKVVASGVALNAGVFIRGGPVMTPAAGDTIGRALESGEERSDMVSPYQMKMH